MENMVYTGITIAILILWYFLQGKVMTPYDIYRKWKSDISYTSPEALDVRLEKTRRAIRKLEEIFDAHGPNTDAGAEAVEILQQLRACETKIRQQR
jgi:hypothetical protein